MNTLLVDWIKDRAESFADSDRYRNSKYAKKKPHNLHWS